MCQRAVEVPRPKELRLRDLGQKSRVKDGEVGHLLTPEPSTEPSEGPVVLAQEHRELVETVIPPRTP